MTLEHLINILALAAAPVVELRGAIPVAMHSYDFPWPAALLVSLIGNILPIPFVLILLKPLTRVASRVGLLDRLIRWVFDLARRRSVAVRKYEKIGLALFVAVPLPGTGAWTGAIIAHLLEMKFWYAFISIAVGVVIAGVIVTALSLLGWIGAIVAGVVLAALTFSGARKFLYG
ncbi:MAG: small multi-drug export protein [Chloroflexi bacterium]|nr:small multi-drug export protein [Chloroflexota bacterium]